MLSVMISFAPEEHELQLADSARSFAADVLRPRLREHESARAVSDDARRAFHELGLVGMDLPEELGFGGIPLTARALVEEELAAGDLGAAVALDATGLAGEVLRAFPEKRKRLLEPFLEQPLRRAALAVGRSVLGGARAQLFVRIDQDLQAWAVEGAMSAVEDRDVLGLAEIPPAAVQLSSGEKLGDAREALQQALLRYAGVNSARAVGCARAAFEHARRYAEERTAFGKPIGHFQAIAFLLADMATEIEGARALTWRACVAHDRAAADAPLRLLQARAHTSEMLDFVASSAVQILGGAGYVQDHPVEKWMRDARVLAQVGLTAEAARASDFSCQGALT
jgi:alkylation response protein AidB-like acyl-CoA dehydrogenase